MRVHVALSPADFAGLSLRGHTALVVDVLRATTTVVAACAAGCPAIVPVADPATALARAARFRRGEALLAGEQGGEPIAGFDLGNSPLEYVTERVAGRTVILTTTNGTAAMLLAQAAEAAAVAALVNVGAAAGWALARGRDVTVLCAGEEGTLALEDAVCAGLLVERIAAACPSIELSDGATAARRLGGYYEARMDRLRLDARWARHLARRGRSADLDACLRLDATALVPVFDAGVIVPQPRAASGLAAALGETGRWPDREMTR